MSESNQHSELLLRHAGYRPDEAEALERLIEQLGAAQTLDRSMWREGMVTVYDYEGNYVGCMGRELWDWLLEQGYEKLRGLKEQYEVVRQEVLKQMARAEAAEDRVTELQEQAEVEREEGRVWRAIANRDEPEALAERERILEQLEAAQRDEQFQFARAERGFAIVRELQEQLEALKKALRAIAEGGLGDEPWFANYERIREYAQVALASSPASSPPISNHTDAELAQFMQRAVSDPASSPGRDLVRAEREREAIERAVEGAHYTPRYEAGASRPASEPKEGA